MASLLFKALSLSVFVAASTLPYSVAMEDNPLDREPLASLTPRESRESSPLNINPESSRSQTPRLPTPEEIIIRTIFPPQITANDMEALIKDIFMTDNDLPLTYHVSIQQAAFTGNFETYGKLHASLANSRSNCTLNLSNNNIGSLQNQDIKDYFAPFLDKKTNNKIRQFLNKKDQLLHELQTRNESLEDLENYAQTVFENCSTTLLRKRSLFRLNLSNNFLGYLYETTKEDNNEYYTIGNPTIIWTQLIAIPNLHTLDLTNNNLNALNLLEYEEMLQILLKSKSLRRLIMSTGNLMPDKQALIKQYEEQINRYRKIEDYLIIEEETEGRHA